MDEFVAGYLGLSARVWSRGQWGPPFDHMALRVEAGGQSWLADVGFGRFARHPLRWAERGDAEALATYRERFGVVLDRLPPEPVPTQAS